jgi:glyoxylase-like metal-dependent hydrolase (beta-lactamase superfamily II)
MMPEEPVPGIIRISVPTPFPVGPVNCYVLPGPEPVLVDTGPATPEAEQALRRELAALGIEPSAIAWIVLTHHHPDHAGGLGWLGRTTAARVVGHPDNDLWLLGDPDENARRVAFYAALNRYYGLSDREVALLQRWAVGYDKPVAPRPIGVPVREGATLTLGGATWRVLETPGHAGTSISLVRDDGVAIVGDTLLDRISSNALPEPLPGEHRRSQEQWRPPTMLAYRRSLHRLAALPLTTLLAGHGAPFSDHAALIARRLAGQEERAQRLLAGLGAGPMTVAALTRVLFPTLPDAQLFLGLSEVVGHLDILEEQGLAQHTGDAPARYMRVAT